MKRTIPYFRDQYLLNPGIVFLNHGSFGATSRYVFESYQKWQRELEFQPVEFLGRRQKGLLEESRTTLAVYLGTDKNNIVYVPNTTIGLNIIARSLSLGPGEEVLTSTHEYGAMNKMWRYLEQKKGFSYSPRETPLPINSVGSLIDSFWSGVTPETRVIFISHITSPTAIIFPVKEICNRARSAGIITIIDGAHAPGQVDINLDELGADFYVGNLHKWLCAPKGSAFIFAHPSVQDLLEPSIVSWGCQNDEPNKSPFIDMFEYVGTRDIAAFLSIPDAISYQKNNDWNQVRKYCHFLAELTQKIIVELTGIPALHSNNPRWFSQMGSAPLPIDINCELLQIRLYKEYKIEIPVYEWNNYKLIRFSFQAYNHLSDVNDLIKALKCLLIDPGLRIKGNV